MGDLCQRIDFSNSVLEELYLSAPTYLFEFDLVRRIELTNLPSLKKLGLNMSHAKLMHDILQDHLDIAALLVNRRLQTLDIQLGGVVPENRVLAFLGVTRDTLQGDTATLAHLTIRVLWSEEKAVQYMRTLAMAYPTNSNTPLEIFRVVTEAEYGHPPTYHGEPPKHHAHQRSLGEPPCGAPFCATKPSNRRLATFARRLATRGWP